MRHTTRMFAVTALLALTFAAAPAAQSTQTQTQAQMQIVDQISALLKQLHDMLNTPPPPQQPPVPMATTAAELSTALQAGGPLQLAPGTYVGNFVISKATSITGPTTAILEPLDKLIPTLTVTGNDVTVRGLTIHNGAPDRDTVVVGTSSATSADLQPHRVLFDGTQVVAGATGGHRGFSLHGVDITLHAVAVTGFLESRRDSQAVWINNGPGPYTITDSVLEASGENLMVGGDDPGIVGMNPSDITIRGNVLRKPQEWRAYPGSVKNILELKAGVRVLIENNLLDGNWRDAQAGNAIVFTVRNQGGACTWCQVDDVVFRGNTLKNSTDGYAVNILGSDYTNPSRQTQRMTIEGNLFVDSPRGFLIGNGVATDLTIRHNTLPGITGTFLAFLDTRAVPVVTPLTFADNVVAQGEYGMNAGDYAYPFAQLVTFVNFTGNIIEKNPARQIKVPAGNTWVEAGAFKSLLDPVTYKLINGTAGY